MAVFRLCKVLILPEVLLTDAMYMVRSGDSVVIYVTDDNGVAYPFKPGLSAYEVALQLGFEGTEAEWIASLHGDDGISAYQVAVNNGFEGTEAEWLASLEYDPGYTPQDAANRETDSELSSNDDAHYPSTKAARTFIASAISGANAYADTAAADAMADAKSYADTGDAATLSAANSHADTASASAESSAKSYADTVSGDAEQAAKSYADTAAATAAADAEVAAKEYADLLVVSALKLKGGYDASTNLWPSTAGIKAGWLYFVSIPGTLGGKAVVVGDSFFAVQDNPGQTNANWCVLDTNLGFVPEEAGTAAAAISAHLLASDPHGDRAYALSQITSAISIHTAASDPHGDRAAAASALAAHIIASDPHGDRAYTDGVLAAKSSAYDYRSMVQEFEDFATYAVTNSTGVKYRYQGSYSTLQSKASLIASIANGERIQGWAYLRLSSTTFGDSGVLCRSDGGSGGNFNNGNNWSTGAVYQALFSIAFLDLLPGATNDFNHLVGFCCPGLSASAMSSNPFGIVGQEYSSAMGAAGFFKLDKGSPNFICVSGVGASIQTTTTNVAAALNTLYSLRLKVTENGQVNFYINDSLVASHTGNGVITSGKSIGEFIATRNISSTNTAAKPFILDAIGYRFTLPGLRSGLMFE